MKKILYLSILLFSASFIGCSDLLDVTPETDMTDAAFWKTENDLKTASNQLYYQLDNTTNVAAHDTRSDEQVGKSTNSTSAGTRSVPSTSGDWTDIYNRIFTANNIIEKGSNAPISENLRNRWVAEAYFFRAYYHFDLVKKYGDVPMILKAFTSVFDPDLKMGRTPREEVIQQCYADLEFAAKYLPTRAAWTTNDEFDRRRVTRSSALGLIVRIGLSEGTMQKYHSLSNDAIYKAHLKKSIDAFELLKSEGHALYPDLRAMFFEEDNSKNKEIIFGKAYGPNGGASLSPGHSFSGDSEGSYSLTRPMVDQFLYADGLPGEKTALKIPVETSLNNAIGKDVDWNTLPLGARDPRLEITIWTVNDPMNPEWVATGKGASGFRPFVSERPYGYAIKKAFSGSRWGASKDYTDRFIIRYGEMLISYAEALYEYNGSITDAQLDETVNALRARVGFTAKLTNAFASTNGLNMRDEIRRERTVELMTEGLRYQDIIRWKIAENVLPQAMLGMLFVDDEAATSGLRPGFTIRLTTAGGKLPDGTQVNTDQADIYVIELAATRRFDPGKDYYYPIPTFEIAQSGGNIVQNPKWNE